MTNRIVRFGESKSSYNIRSDNLRSAPGSWQGLFLSKSIRFLAHQDCQHGYMLQQNTVHMEALGFLMEENVDVSSFNYSFYSWCSYLYVEYKGAISLLCL